MVFGSPHPVSWRAARGQKVVRRAPRSNECNACINFLVEVLSRGDETNIKSKGEFQQTVANSDEARVQLRADMDKWHEQDTEDRSKRRGCGANDERGKKAKTLCAVEEESREYETCVGVFWPAALYKMQFKKRLPRSKREQRNGQWGVVLPTSACATVPDGCSRILVRTSQVIKEKTKLADDKEEVRDGQFTSQATVAREGIQLHRKGSSKSLESSKPVALTSVSGIKATSHTIHTLLEEPFTTSFHRMGDCFSDSDDEEGGGSGGGRKRGVVAARSSSAEGQPKVRKATGDEVHTPEKKQRLNPGNASKSQSALQATRKLKFDVDSFMDGFKVGSTLLKASRSALKKLQDRVAQRFEPSVVSQHGDEFPRGELERRKLLLRVVESLVDALDPAEKEDGFAPVLLSAMETALGGGVVLCGKAVQE